MTNGRIKSTGPADKVVTMPRSRQRAAWCKRLDVTSGGRPRPTHHNLLLALEHDQSLVGLYALDEFSGRITMQREPPWGGRAGELTDATIAELAAYLGDPDGHCIAAGTGVVHEAIVAAATRRPFHPVRAYLDSITWDGTERLAYMFADFFGARRDEYTAAVGLNWMTAAAARVRSPGCQVDIMPILEGRQGARKSTALRILAGEAWFAEAMESPLSKDFHQSLVGRWIIEIAEMQSFSRAEVPRVKQAVSTRVDVYRPSYGRVARAYARQCVFAGTTNETEYLRDATGARRFLPVRVDDIDIEALAAVRDQLWAEADARFHAGEPWWILPAQAVDEQDARYQHDAWEDVIATWLDGHGSENSYPADHIGPITEITTHEIMTRALRVEIARQTRQDQMRVGTIIQRLGWVRQRVRRDGVRMYVYTRPESIAT